MFALAARLGLPVWVLPLVALLAILGAAAGLAAWDGARLRAAERRGADAAAAVWQRRWNEQQAENDRAAADALARQGAELRWFQAAAADSAGRWADAESKRLQLASANADLVRRLRIAANQTAAGRPGDLPAACGPAADSGASAGGPGPGELPAGIADDLAAFAARCADERERNASQVRELKALWPKPAPH